MKREFNIGDIATLSDDRREKYECGENYKLVTLKFMDEVKILGYVKMDSSVGGWGYNVSFNGIELINEIPQYGFIPKKLLEKMNKLEQMLKKG